MATALVFVALGSAASAEPRVPSFVIAETGEGFSDLADAVAAIGDGQGTVLIAPGVYRQCAVQDGGFITYRAEQSGTAIFDGTVCEGKAALVLKGRKARVQGLVFRNLRVADGNGAGIRLQAGDLTVVESLFERSEEGILTHDDPQATISIDRSTFRHLGRCDRDLPCAHSIYVGNYALLRVTNSRFEAGDGGHYVKTRSAAVVISSNSFDDSAGYLTNYMIDLSNGASGIISRNEMEQGRDKDNYSLFISIAPEGREHDSGALEIRENVARFSPGLDRRSTFVANWTDDVPRLTGNMLAPGIEISGRR